MDWRQLASAVPNWEQSNALPDGDDSVSALGHFHDALTIDRPERVTAMFALPGRRISSRRLQPTRLVAVSRYRTPYSIIARVAESIALAILTTGVIPIIDPIRESEMQELDADYGFGFQLSARGIYVWSAQE